MLHFQISCFHRHLSVTVQLIISNPFSTITDNNRTTTLHGNLHKLHSCLITLRTSGTLLIGPASIAATDHISVPRLRVGNVHGSIHQYLNIPR